MLAYCHVSMELAKGAPSAEFIGNIYGSLTCGKQYLQGELEAGRLTIRGSFEDDLEDESEDESEETKG